MPTDHLTPATSPRTGSGPDTVETPDPVYHPRLVERSRRESRWRQVTVEFTDWAGAPLVVAHRLAPVLDRTGKPWWYIRKHPHWRLRHRHTGIHTGEHARAFDPSATDQDDILRRVLDQLVDDRVVRAWHPVIYEPETHAFGGPAGMDLAHDLFCRDSRTTLDLLTTPTRPGHDAGPVELSVLAVSRMLRSAGLDWYEQGDVWAQVAAARPPIPTTRPPAPHAAAAARRLVALDTGPTTTLLVGGPLAPYRAWLDAFDTTGTRLAALARTGRLTRGLRAVLAHHVIFHWNRLALTADQQHTLATLARDTLLPPGHTTPASGTPSTGTKPAGNS